MNRYTIEDIEIIRRKSGISYEEAVNLLEYHNGNLAKALVDLERNGRIRTEEEEKASHAHQGEDGKRKAKGLLSKLFRIRVLVRKNDVVIANLSSLFLLVALLVSSHLLIISLILILVLGYRVSIERNSKDFAANDLENMVKNAAVNVKDTVTSFARELADDDEAPPREDSFYASGRRGPAPSEQTPPTRPDSARPVTVNCPQDGGVEIEDGDDGYTEATIR
ncbi:MAG: hypothetical protein IJ461_07685 [Clostridia bacterium]|nr:hypothetical protein [Clostridia bacterium]